jgi:hypothetical protein
MSVLIISGAIKSRNLIQFQYSGGNNPGLRLVEPYMLACNQAGHLALNAWFLGGESESQAGQGWREYLLTEIQSAIILPQLFSPPRPGYNPTGGKKFYNVQAAV